MRRSANRSTSLVDTPGRMKVRRSVRMPRMMRFASSMMAISAGDFSVVFVTMALDPSQTRTETGAHVAHVAESVDLDQNPLATVGLRDGERLLGIDPHPLPNDLLPVVRPLDERGPADVANARGRRGPALQMKDRAALRARPPSGEAPDDLDFGSLQHQHLVQLQTQPTQHPVENRDLLEGARKTVEDEP